MLASDGPATGRLPSHSSGLADLITPFAFAEADRGPLRMGDGWPRRWTVTFAGAGDSVTCPVAELPGSWRSGVRPVRRFGWRTRQRHRPGLQYLVSTGRHHGFESLAEQRLLLALDFVGVADALAQPFELRFTTADGWVRHVPDFLVVGRDGLWLIDVRPADRLDAEARVRFAAAAEMALLLGWRFTVVTGWRPHVSGTLDALSAQRRPLADPLGLQPQLLAQAGDEPLAFRKLVQRTAVPVVARAHALHLIWHHRLGVDLAEPFGDDASVWAVPRLEGRS